MDTMVWRLAAANPAGVPYQDARAKWVIIGSTDDLGDGERLWFRLRSDGQGDTLSRDPVVAEVRTSERARERVTTITEMYRGLRWVFVEHPRHIHAPDPPVTPEEILAGWPLITWAEAVAAQMGRGGGVR
jgi:hypothetical protein